jgi:hypothetical protein
MGSEFEAPGVVECILMLDGRLIGTSAVVKRRLRSELREDDESVRSMCGRESRCEGLLGRISCCEGRLCGLTCGTDLEPLPLLPFPLWSAKKSIHDSPSLPRARKCEATTPCE